MKKINSHNKNFSLWFREIKNTTTCVSRFKTNFICEMNQPIILSYPRSSRKFDPTTFDFNYQIDQIPDDLDWKCLQIFIIKICTGYLIIIFFKMKFNWLYDDYHHPRFGLFWLVTDKWYRDKVSVCVCVHKCQIFNKKKN